MNYIEITSKGRAKTNFLTINVRIYRHQDFSKLFFPYSRRHGLNKIYYIKSFVITGSRHFPISAIKVTQLYTPPHVKLYVLPIHCMSKSTNIEDLEICKFG